MLCLQSVHGMNILAPRIRSDKSTRQHLDMTLSALLSPEIATRATRVLRLNAVAFLYTNDSANQE